MVERLVKKHVDLMNLLVKTILMRVKEGSDDYRYFLNQILKITLYD